ncbi:MAG: heme-binding protein [Gammaproteobacteria bacterium]|nr:heme-binding protein [Gammaproteobacteria bacterium]
MAIEEPGFELLKTAEGYELRRYAAYVVAEVDAGGDASAAGNQGFRLLAGYIFGKNTPGESISMTAPVLQAKAERIAMTAPVLQQPGAGKDQYVVQFTMPAKYTLATLPRPVDPRVRLREVPARKVAVREYRGGWSVERYEREVQELRAALKRDGLEALGEPHWARYNSPFSLPPLRHNEVWIDVR